MPFVPFLLPCVRPVSLPDLSVCKNELKVPSSPSTSPEAARKSLIALSTLPPISVAAVAAAATESSLLSAALESSSGVGAGDRRLLHDPVKLRKSRDGVNDDIRSAKL